MNPKKNRRWLLSAVLLLVFLVGLWILSALQLQPAAAGGSRISLSLRSGLAADYGAREGSLLGSLNLSIVSDFMQDLGMAPAEAEAQADEMAAALASPVPSSTALNFQGDPPPTLTPTATYTATSTPAPTSTPRSLPTRTDTPEPTDTAKPAATSGPKDDSSPKISGGNLSQSGGSISCNQTITVSDLRVLDPDYSSGIQYVKLKYSLDGGPYVYSALSKTSGGWTSPGSTWDAMYAGSITISDPVAAIDGSRKVAALPFLISDTDTPVPTNTPTYTPTATPDPTPTATPSSNTYSVELYAIVRDNAGKTDHVHLSDYSMTCP